VARRLGMESKQAFHDEIERYRVLLAETTDPLGLLLLKDIIGDMEDMERRWADLAAQQVKNIQDPVRAYQAYQVGAPIEACPVS
jgi:hypothetical protein